MFERALKRDPAAADTHYALAATRARLGAVETAIQSLERAVELKPVLRDRLPHTARLKRPAPAAGCRRGRRRNVSPRPAAAFSCHTSL
jgi:hypothetical protein